MKFELLLFVKCMFVVVSANYPYYQAHFNTLNNGIYQEVAAGFSNPIQSSRFAYSRPSPAPIRPLPQPTVNPQIYSQTQQYQDYSQPHYPQSSLNPSQYNPIVQTYSTVPQTYQNVPQTTFKNNQHFTSNNFYAQPVQAQVPDQSLGIRVGDRIFRNGCLNWLEWTYLLLRKGVKM